MSSAKASIAGETSQWLGRTLAIGACYFVLARLGLLLAVIHPSASPVWPATGFAFAAVLLFGIRVWPALFIAAFLANVTASGGVSSSLAISAGNTLEAVAFGIAVARWSDGVATFENPAGVARFALISLAATLISPIIGVGSLWLLGQTTTASFGTVWATWWLGDLGGALVVAPAVVLWLMRTSAARDLRDLAPLYAAAGLVGLLAFSPIVEHPMRGLLPFAAIVPLLWAALREGPRETATIVLILSVFAVWGTLEGESPLTGAGLNESFLLTLAFVISAALPSLILSADVTARNRIERKLRAAHDDLEARVQSRTEDLTRTNQALCDEIEQRQKLEAAHERQRVQLLDAQRIAKLGSWCWDVRSGRVDWSAQLFKVYGISPAEFGGTIDDFLTRIHPEDRAPVSERIAEAMHSHTGFDSEERIVRPDGTIRHLRSFGEVIKDTQGEVVQMLGICQDVTEHLAAVTALRENEQTLRLLTDGIRDHALILLDASGNVVSWNAGAARIYQYDRNEVLGKHYSLFHIHEDRAANLPADVLKNAITEGRYEGEGWRLRKDRSRFWAHVVIERIDNETGSLAGLAKITRDISEKRKADRSLEEAREQLAQAQKMETIGQVAGGIAHDFNNLLAAQMASLRLLEKRLPAETQERRLVDTALQAAERGAALTQRLLAFARRQELKPEPVDVPQLVRDMLELLRRSIGPAVQIETSFPGRPTLARVDRNQLELAIFNLAVNARDAMLNGGPLVLEVTSREVEKSHERIDLGAGDYVRIAVRDRGMGMDQATLKRATEPFFTTKGVGKGTGLGLSMVHGLAAQSGGALEIVSAPGEGTTVTIWLPVAEASASAEPKNPQSKPAAVQHAPARVLVVDDDPLVAMGTVDMLQDLGHSTVEAFSGRQALDILESDPNFDVVITDQAMPGMTGLELAKRIRETRPDLPIILATGYAELPQDRISGMPRLSKPYRQEELADCIDMCRSGGQPSGPT
jgi:PAS domain S-box-containing protein